MASNSVPIAEDDGDDRGVRGEEALERLRSADPPLYLSPSPELSSLARAASRQLFSSLIPFCPKTPFDRLLAGDSFDAEQIWGQIDSLSRPLVSMLRRELKRIERDPPSLISAAAVGGAAEAEKKGDTKEAEEDDGEEETAEEEEEEEDDDDDDDEEEEEDDEDEEVAAGDEKGSGIEDRFLKIKELEEYLENDEAKEYGHPERRGQRKEKDEDDEGEEEEDDSELGSFDDDGNEETDSGESARYEDFFGSNKKRGGGKSGGGKKEKASSKKVNFDDGLEDSEMNDEQKDDEDGREVDDQDNALSTHEKQIQKINSKKEQMEKSNLEAKSWTMQGEVTASKRPKNSALEVDLDFEHNARPAPVITEEVTASLEDLIRKRVIEGQFDDVQKAPALPSKAPKELKELDENKSKKGLAEIYEEDYAQKAGLASIPLSSSDEQKKEASILFKKLCLKLDAVSHFHFAPKPIIEDMSIQANVPALAMEEIAPVAVSDAAMLAPEEIFKGKGDIKEETELTQVERKRRRANKKRRFKAGSASRAAKKTRVSGAPPDHPNGKENS